MRCHGLGWVLVVLVSSQVWGQTYQWQCQDNGWVLSANEKEIGRWLPETSAALTTEDSVDTIRTGVFRLRRVVRNAGQATLESLRLTLDFVHADSATFLMIPAVTYNGNTWGRGKEPKGFKHDGQWWSFSSYRTPIPGATYSEGSRWAVALWAQTTEDLPVLSCSLMPDGDRTTHRLIWPQEEQPLLYSGRDRYAPGTRGELKLKPGESLTLTGILVVDRVQAGHRAIETFLAEAWKQGWEQHGRGKEMAAQPEELWNLGVQYARSSLWAEESMFRGFSIGLLPHDDGWAQRDGWKYEIGWCGQNASLANSLLLDYLETRNDESLQKGLACLDCWAAHCVLPNGLFRTHFDSVLTERTSGELLDACNLGTAALNYFEAFELAKKCGEQRPQYRALALGICRFMASNQEPSGRYGKAWSPDGACPYRDGTVGAFLIAPMLEAHRALPGERFLDSARRAFAFYYEEFERLGCTSGGALDTWCIDKESAIPLLRAALELHEVTGQAEYLKAAEHVSWYLSTWLWHYSARYPEASDFARYGFDTFGGTSVSTQHHHLDPYALMWVADWLDLAERTGDPIWKQKAIAIWYNAIQLVSDGSLEIHGRTRPAGSQNEGYLHAAWSGRPGTVNDWLVAWPGALRLETLRRLEDWDALR